MNINYLIDNGKLYFYLSGELDEHYAKGVKEYIEAVLEEIDTAKNVVFNMSKLTFMDSTGIGMLLGRYKKLKKCGIACFIEDPTPSVEKVLELSGIYEVIPKL